MFRKLLMMMAVSGTMWAATTYDQISGEEMVSLLQDAGYKAVLKEDNSGDPKVVTKMGGLNVSIYFYGCEGEKGAKQCKTYQFYAGYDQKLDDKKVVEWNAKKRFARCYTSSDGNARVEYDVSTDGGVNKAFITRSFDRWEVILDEFTKFIGW